MQLNKAKSEGLHLLKLLNILSKKDELVRNLSGGMKRKLSLAIALVGSPNVCNIITVLYHILNRQVTRNNIGNLFIDFNLR